jgi:hypothetical protein
MTGFPGPRIEHYRQVRAGVCLVLLALCLFWGVETAQGSGGKHPPRETDLEKVSESLVRAKFRKEDEFSTALRHLYDLIRDQATTFGIIDLFGHPLITTGKECSLAYEIKLLYEKFTDKTKIWAGSEKPFYLSTVIMDLYEAGAILEIGGSWHDLAQNEIDRRLNEIKGVEKALKDAKLSECFGECCLESEKGEVHTEAEELEDLQAELERSLRGLHHLYPLLMEYVGRKDGKNGYMLAYWDDQIHIVQKAVDPTHGTPNPLLCKRAVQCFLEMMKIYHAEDGEILEGRPDFRKTQHGFLDRLNDLLKAREKLEDETEKEKLQLLIDSTLAKIKECFG